MEQRAIKALLEQVAAGQVDVNDALLKLKMEPFEELGFAKLDSHRGLRQGVSWFRWWTKSRKCTSKP